MSYFLTFKFFLKHTSFMVLLYVQTKDLLLDLSNNNISLPGNELKYWSFVQPQHRLIFCIQMCLYHMKRT